MTSWAEQMRHDAALRAFVHGEINRAAIDAQALRVENEHQREVIQSQKDKIRELENQLAKRKKG